MPWAPRRRRESITISRLGAMMAWIIPHQGNVNLYRELVSLIPNPVQAKAELSIQKDGLQVKR